MQPAKKNDLETRSPSKEQRLRLADGDTPALASPAAQLQEQLYHAFDEAEIGDKWSHRRTAAFVLVTCGGFWASLIGLARFGL